MMPDGKSQTNMFWGNPGHNLNATTSSTALFAETSWKLNVAAPVRSTVACNAKTVFFGSSNDIPRTSG